MLQEAEVRKGPQNVPSEPNAFKRWADRECTKWPAPLQAKAYHAWAGLEKSDCGPFTKFLVAFSLWENDQ